MKTKILSALAFMICLVVFPCSAQNAAQKDTTVTFSVSGIICGMDLPIICKRVMQEKGVKDCKAVSKASATSKFEVTYNPSEITYQKVVDAIQDAPSCDYPNEKPYKVKKSK